jgi:hypothetical protein
LTTPMTRRELRELERVAVTNEPRVPAPIEQQVLSQVPFRDQSLDRASESSEHFEVASPLLTRRQMREQGLLGSTAEANSSNFVYATNLTLPSHEEPVSPRLNSRRGLREASFPDAEVPVEISEEDSSTIRAIDAPDEQLFTGANLFAEPSTQSIVLEGVTEAISLPMDTGEIFTTGSISIVSDPATGAHTAGFDLDGISQGQESVFGVVSTVSPVSALDLIDQRSSIGVVPQSVLRKGWWKPWALAVCALVLAITAILASITILGAIGG